MAKVISILGVLLLSVFAPLAAQDRAAEMIGALAAEFRAKGAYEVDFEVAVGEYRTRGSYAVEGGRYHLILGDAEVYADTSVRYEIDNRRREVTINLVDTASRNILNNPVHAFDFLGSEYVPTLLSEHDGLTTLVLAPAAGNSAPVGRILRSCSPVRSATISTASGSWCGSIASERSAGRSRHSTGPIMPITSGSTSDE